MSVSLTVAAVDSTEAICPILNTFSSRMRAPVRTPRKTPTLERGLAILGSPEWGEEEIA
jgi:hypothetical protein